ncbi:AraC family transcriptional regulator [Levilactobacillus hammesii]|uniref:AraC family transcriptional regulator n=1 Tax=Levilactobacillus hammesii DSM 16381 TaxID=1423753 RepID=A0A0R1UQL4_9LACO|nr:AraC family transcriptional regulator [Levilactobacillus hammesii]KRL95462.1 AraC family transcriptional regulator [Levilactobacillus hammesii DSM 16381]
MKRLPLINTQFTLFGGHMETVQPGWHWKPEAHLAFELMYIMAGTQRTTSEIGELVTRVGEFIIIPAGIRHNNFVVGAQPLTYFAIHFNLDDPSFKYMLTRGYANQIIRADWPVYADLKRCTARLITLFSTKYGLTDKLNIEMNTINLIMILLDAVKTQGQFSFDETNPDQFLLCTKMAQDLKQQVDHQVYYGDHPNHISIAAVVSRYNISQSYALDLFKKYYGQSPQRYLMTLKLEVAQKLLRQPKMQVKQVAERLAYADTSHFGREFKKQFGLTPRAFIRNERSIHEKTL